VFVGHFGVGLVAKRIAPRASLGWLIAAPLLLDLVWPVFLLLGWETVRIKAGATVVTPLEFVSYPLSHSLLAVGNWAVLAGIVYWAISRYARGALVIAACVVSHWFLDWVVHVPDLPLYPGGAKYGLGLWNSVAATLAAEGLFLGVGVWLYVRSTAATSRGGWLGWWSFVGFLVVVYAANLLGPPPEQVEEVAVVTLSLWLMPLWAWSFDRRRAAVVQAE
jgi:hypothetical protein